MELYCILGIMLITGILGGIVNFYSDANKQTGSESTAKLRSAGVCILFGIAATILVPLFLKFAESKLLDGIRLPDENSKNKKTTAGSTETKPAAYAVSKSDSLPSEPQTTTPVPPENNPKPEKPKSTSEDKNSLASDYLIWTAYCLLAACAGMRFIDLLMNKFLTQAQVEKLEKENQETKTENIKLETRNNKLVTKVENRVKADEKRKKNLEISEQNIVEKLNSVFPAFANESPAKSLNKEDWIPELPPIKFADDPQKGRFGGKSSFNGRTLSVTYEKYFLTEYLKLKIRVSADSNDNPLTGNVYLFLHDSFADSVVMYMAEGRTEIEHEVISYGAFTIGAILDNGNTLLELDIAELKNFPESFRNR